MLPKVSTNTHAVFWVILEQVVQGGCRWPLPGSVQSQTACGLGMVVGTEWSLRSLPAQTVLWFYHIKHQFCRSPFIPLEKGIARQEKLDKYENDPSFSRSCSLTSVQKKSRKYLLVFQPHCFSHIGSLGLSCLLLWENIKQTSAKTEAWTTS